MRGCDLDLTFVLAIVTMTFEFLSGLYPKCRKFIKYEKKSIMLCTISDMNGKLIFRFLSGQK